MGIGDWGLGIGDWGLGTGDWGGRVMRVGLVACGKGRLGHGAPARAFYNGSLFRKASGYAAARYDAWFVLSPMHHLVAPDHWVEPYDLSLRHLTRAEREAWADEVVRQLRERGLEEAEFFLHAGENYADPLGRRLGRTRRPLRGLGIGRQLAWYKERGC